MKKRYAKMSIVILILAIIDQIIKFIVINQSNETLEGGFLENFGGAFGIGQDSTLFFILANIVILGIIIKFIISQKDRVDKKTLTSFTFILSGGISNLIDRIFRGCVVDYIDVSKYIDFPVFNLADVFIVVGWFMLLISIIIYWNKEVRVLGSRQNKEENS